MKNIFLILSFFIFSSAPDAQTIPLPEPENAAPVVDANSTLSESELTLLKSKSDVVKDIYDFYQPTYQKFIEGLTPGVQLTYIPGNPEARVASSGNVTDFLATLLFFDRLRLNVQEITALVSLKRKISTLVFNAPGRDDGVDVDDRKLANAVHLKINDTHKVEYRIRDLVNGGLVAFFGATIAKSPEEISQKFFEITNLLRGEVYNWFGRWRDGTLPAEQVELIHGAFKPTSSVAAPVAAVPEQQASAGPASLRVSDVSEGFENELKHKNFKGLHSPKDDIAQQELSHLLAHYADKAEFPSGLDVELEKIHLKSQPNSSFKVLVGGGFDAAPMRAARKCIDGFNVDALNSEASAHAAAMYSYKTVSGGQQNMCVLVLRYAK